MDAAANPRVVSALQSFARIAANAVVLVGFLVLMGWLFNVNALKGIYPGLGTMKVNTAFCFLLSGISLWLYCSPKPLPTKAYIIAVCAGTVAMLGLLMLLDYFFKWDLELDQLLLRQPIESYSANDRLRTAPSTSLNLLLVGLSLLLIDREFPRGIWLTQILALFAMLISLLAFIGYLYGVHSFYGFGADVYVSLHSAITFFLLCLGILAARPDRGLMAIVSNNGVGGILARRLLPAAIALPIVLGGLVLIGHRRGWYDTEFRLSLLVGLCSLVFGVLIWWDAASLRSIDSDRQRAEFSLRRYTQRLQNLLEVGRVILAARSQIEIASSAITRLRHQLPCELAMVTLFDFEEGVASVVAVDTHTQLDSPHPGQLHAGACLQLERVGFGDIEALLRGDPLIVRDLADHNVPAAPRRSLGPRHLPTLLSWLEAEKARAYFNIPLVTEGEVMGCLTVGWLEPTVLDEETIGMVREVADRLSIGIQQSSLFEQVRSGREQLKTLSHRLIEAQEAERRHIAHELHDEVGQALTAIKINLQAVQRRPEPNIVQSRLDDSIGIVENVLRQVRDLSLDLRPSMLDDLGLVAALRWYIDRQAQRAGFEVRLSADPIEPRLPPEIETACFRVAQEAFTNIVRHAAAGRVEVRLRIGDSTRNWEPPASSELQLMIRDNGLGFDVAGAQKRASAGSSLGLLGMEERVLLVGGKIEVESTPGTEELEDGPGPIEGQETPSKRSRGTVIRAYFPLPASYTLQPHGRRVANEILSLPLD